VGTYEEVYALSCKPPNQCLHVFFFCVVRQFNSGRVTSIVVCESKWGPVKNFMHCHVTLEVNVFLCFFGLVRLEMGVQ